MSSATQRITAVVAKIPSGQVRSYAQVAMAAGLPGRARQVARVLASGDGSLPWHRVVRADGRIAFAAGSAQADEQAARLRAEGVPVQAGRVGKPQRPAASLDQLLWGSDHHTPV